MNKILYRCSLESAAAIAGVHTVILNWGYPAPLGLVAIDEGAAPQVGPTVGAVANTEITSLDKAVSETMSMIRRFQAIGVDCRGQVFGKVVDFTGNGEAPAPASPQYVLQAGDIAEQVYANLDTPDRGLVARINASNKSALGAAALAPNDEPEDVE